MIDTSDEGHCVFIPPHDWRPAGKGSNQSSMLDSKDDASWKEKDSIRAAFEEGLERGQREVQEMRRSATFDSIDSVVKKPFVRTDTSTTLVGDNADDEKKGEIPEVPTIPEGDWDVQTPVTETKMVIRDKDGSAP